LSFVELFWSIFEFNCCGCMVACVHESNKHRLSILLVEHWMGWSTSVKNGKELEVCDCSHVLDLCTSHNQCVHVSHGDVKRSILPLMMYKGFLKYINIHSRLNYEEVHTWVKVVLEPAFAWKPDLEIWVSCLQLLIIYKKWAKINKTSI